MGKHGRTVGGQGCGVIIICFKILACLILVNVFGLLFSLFVMGFIMIVSICVIIIITTIIMVIIWLYTQCNHQNNYQIINHSFKVHLLAEHSTFILLIFVVVPVVVVVVVVVWIINQYFHQ